jgi:hypothetical protein
VERILAELPDKDRQYQRKGSDELGANRIETGHAFLC